jgi:hypothetical protein
VAHDREKIENDPRSGRPISSTNDQNVEMMRDVMAKNLRMSVRMIAEETGLDKTSKTGPASPNGHCGQLGAAPR